MASSDEYFEQQRRIASAKAALLDALIKCGERDIAVLIAAITELLKRVSDWNLQAERGENLDTN